MKTNYYFLATSLPKLQIGVPPDIDFQEFQTLLLENLNEGDYEKTRYIRWFYDIENIRRYWMKEPLDYWGNLEINDLEEALLSKEEGDLPKYVYNFFDIHPSLDERLPLFPQLLVTYYADLEKKTNGFLKKYAQFERNLRLTLTAFRARKLGRDLAKELQFENPEEDLIVQLMAQKDSKTFIPPVEFEDIKGLLEGHYTSPLELQKALLEYRFEKIEEMVNFDEFSIDRILAYIVQYIMCDKWMLYDSQKGSEILDTIVKELT